MRIIVLMALILSAVGMLAYNAPVPQARVLRLGSRTFMENQLRYAIDSENRVDGRAGCTALRTLTWQGWSPSDIGYTLVVAQGDNPLDYVSDYAAVITIWRDECGRIFPTPGGY